MATNKVVERFAPIPLLMPVSVNIASGQPLIFGHGTHFIAGVACEAQNTSNPAYDENNGYLTLDIEGAYNLTVVAETLASVSAGAAINVGDPVYASGGTFDKVSGITYGFTLCADTGGDFFGIALQSIAAGVTAIIPVMLKNAA